MRLVVRAFANEPSAVYTRLNELTEAANSDFAQGFKASTVMWMRARRRPRVSRSMMSCGKPSAAFWFPDRCRALGGRIEGAVLGDGELSVAEKEVAKEEIVIAQAKDAIAKDHATGDSQSIHRHQADFWTSPANAWIWRLQVLEDKSVEFVTNREMIEIFDNLRLGRVNSEVVPHFDMADPFVATQSELNAWEELYMRSLAGLKDSWLRAGLACRARAGSGVTLIQELNQLTQQVDGRLFTETQLGREFTQYAQNKIVAVIIKLGKLVGISVSAAEAEQIAQHQVGKFVCTSHSSNTDSTPSTGFNPSPVTTASASPILHPMSKRVRRRL